MTYEQNLGERKVHKLKTLNPYFEDVYKRAKTFEVRRNDRDFKVGDILELNEWTGTGFTGRGIAANVTYILSDPAYCKDGFVILGIHWYTTNF